MNQRWRLWLGGILFVAVVAAALYLPGLRRQVNKAKTITEKTAEQARRELLPPAPVTSGEPRVQAKMFWGSTDGEALLVPVTVELPLSSDPTLRAKQILNTLLAGPVDPEARTLPPDAALLAFYILPDGTGVADFSEALANAIPSGIQSEQLAVDSIVRTLEANVPQVRRLKILIHGQEMDTLAGHLDLTQAFQVSSNQAVPARTRSGVSAITAPIQKAYESVKRATRRQ
jgi:Sporulation and spore germination